MKENLSKLPDWKIILCFLSDFDQRKKKNEKKSVVLKYTYNIESQEKDERNKHQHFQEKKKKIHHVSSLH